VEDVEPPDCVLPVLPPDDPPAPELELELDEELCRPPALPPLLEELDPELPPPDGGGNEEGMDEGDGMPEGIVGVISRHAVKPAAPLARQRALTIDFKRMAALPDL
jgi:hypothetical protein